MTSQINPSNINGAYPVAGQDNNSQGFRDNFTNTGTNFTYAAQEITDLQNKAVLKAALTGTTLNNDMLNSLLSNALIADFATPRVALGNLSGTVTIDYSAGHYQTVGTSAAITLAFSNWPTAGQAGLVTVQITVNSTAHTVTFPSAVSINNVGILGLNTSNNTITFAATGVYTFTFVTSNNGSTIAVNESNTLLQPFNATGEQLSATGQACSLSTTGTKFTTTGTWSATLANGVVGQMKEFIMTGDGGDMVITVASPGWGGAGTITFTAVGQGCILRYANSAWWCVGNNGATFA